MKNTRFHATSVALAALLALTVGTTAHAQRVARDADGGAMRAPTADEVKATEGGAKAARPVGLLSGRANPPAIKHADGTVEQELDSSTLMYSVARRNADGSISTYCVTGNEAAERIVKGKTGAQASTAKAAKGAQYAVK